MKISEVVTPPSPAEQVLRQRERELKKLRATAKLRKAQEQLRKANAQPSQK